MSLDLLYAKLRASASAASVCNFARRRPPTCFRFATQNRVLETQNETAVVLEHGEDTQHVSQVLAGGVEGRSGRSLPSACCATRGSDLVRSRRRQSLLHIRLWSVVSGEVGADVAKKPGNY